MLFSTIVCYFQRKMSERPPFDKLRNPMTDRFVKTSYQRVVDICKSVPYEFISEEWRKVIVYYINQGKNIPLPIKDYESIIDGPSPPPVKENYTIYNLNNNITLYKKCGGLSVYYFIVGPEEAVGEYINYEMAMYHPAGYGTYFDKLGTYKSNGYVAYKGWRATCCD